MKVTINIDEATYRQASERAIANRAEFFRRHDAEALQRSRHRDRETLRESVGALQEALSPLGLSLSLVLG